MAIPVASVDTVKEARALEVVCKLAYDGRYLITESSGFVRGDTKSLIPAGEWLEAMYQQRKARRKAKRNGNRSL